MARLIGPRRGVEGAEGAGATGLEPAASGVTGRRSNQLNYAPAQGMVEFIKRGRSFLTYVCVVPGADGSTGTTGPALATRALLLVDSRSPLSRGQAPRE